MLSKPSGGGHFLLLFGHIMLWVTKLYTRYAGVIRGAGLLVVEGTLQWDGAVLSVLGRRVFRTEGA